MAKILVGTVTSSEKDYIIDRFIDSVNKLTDKHDFIMVDTSRDYNFLNYIKRKGVTILKSEWLENYMPNIVEGRRLLRKEFLEGNYDYLLSLDSDVITPPDTIKKLLKHDKDIVSFLVHFGVDDKQPSVFYKGTQGRLWDRTTWAKLKKLRLIKVFAANLGIALIKRKVLERTNYRWHPTEWLGEDYYFAKDIEGKFEWWVDTSVRVEHFNKKLTVEQSTWNPYAKEVVEKRWQKPALNT